MQTSPFVKEEEKTLPAGILANRPLPTTSSNVVEGFDCPTCVQPADRTDIFKEIPGQAPAYGKEEINTIEFTTSYENPLNMDAISLGGDYFLLDHENERKEAEQKKEIKQGRMELATQLYMGGLTVLGLFLLYRMMTQKKL
uniref:Uncharacterized protein n=1 Tax=viral metagenome TaxID=1070528 RepID=A0A6C0I2R5_9ZZZZ